MEGYASLDLAKEFPRVNAWHQRMITRPAIKATLEDREKVMPIAKEVIPNNQFHSYN